MKQKKLVLLKKFLCLSILAAMIASVVSCATPDDTSTGEENNNNNNVVENTNGAVDSDEEEAEVKLTPDLPDEDFGGHTFNFLLQHITGANDAMQNHRDIYAEEQTGDVVNDAVYLRNSYIEEKYNIKIKETRQDDDAVVTALKKSVNAGDQTYDVAFFIMRQSSGLMSGGFLTDLNKLEYVDFTKPWWDHDAVEALSVDNRLYIVNSAITLTANMGTHAFVFNKGLLRDNGLEDPYAMVLNNKWTLDTFGQMTRDISNDINGDGVMDENDRWGLIFQRDTLSSVANGSMVYISQKDENDIPIFTFIGERQITTFDRIFDILYDQTACINVHKEYEPRGDWDVTMNKMFQNNQALFMWIRMRDCESLRAMPTDFGILPIPKADEKQERYLSSVNPHTSTIMGIPATNIEFERTGIILEALAAESYYTVQPAYYEVTLNNKVARDEESSAMLDIIFNNRAYDLGDIYMFGGIDSYIYETMTLKRDMVSFFEKRENGGNRDIERLVTRIQALD